MKKSLQQVIDERAVAFLKTRFAKRDWQIYDIKPDIAVDHLGEIVRSGNYEAQRFVIQLKGQQRVRKLKGEDAIAFPLETHYLRHYVDQEKLPVFLIVVDVRKNVGYWIFLQRYVAENLMNESWRSQQSITIRIPMSNRLRADANLRLAVYSAHQWMLARPRILDEVVDATISVYRALDPRFDIDFSVIKGKRHFLLRPREEISLTFSFKGNHQTSNDKVHDLIDRGMPVHFDAGEIDVEGSKLFTHFLSNGGTFQHAFNTQGTTTIRLIQNGKTVETLPSLSLAVTAGRQEVRLEALSESPLQVSARFSINHQTVNADPLSFRIDIKKWYGRALVNLPGLDTIFRLLEHLSLADSELLVEHTAPNYPPISGTAKFIKNELFEGLLEQVRTLKRAINVARYFGINPIFRRPFKYHEAIEIDMMDKIIRAEKFLGDASGGIMTVTADKSREDVLRTTFLKSNDADGSIRFEGCFRTTAVCDELIEFGPLRVTMQPVRLINDLNQMARILDNPEIDHVELQWQGGTIATIEYEQHPDAPLFKTPLLPAGSKKVPGFPHVL